MMKKAIFLIPSIFLYFNSAAYAGNEYVVLDAENDLLSPWGYGRSIQFRGHEKEKLPQEVNKELFGSKKCSIYKFELKKTNSKISVSGTTGIFKMHDAYSEQPFNDGDGHYAGRYQVSYLTMVLKYNIQEGYTFDGATYYPASLATVETIRNDPWGLSVGEDEVERGLFEARARCRIEETVFKILNDGEEIPPALYERMKNHKVKEFELYSKNARKVMKARIDAKREKYKRIDAKREKDESNE